MMLLLIYAHPDEPINTQYGRIRYFEWLEFEKERIMANPDRYAEIHRRSDGKVGLVVDRVAE